MSGSSTTTARGVLRRFLDGPGRQVVAAMLLVVCGIVGWFGYGQLYNHAEALARAERDTRNLAHLLAEHAARSFQAVDETLRAVGRLRADAARGIYRSQASIHMNLRTLHGGSPLLDEIGWFDVHGERAASSRFIEPPRISVARSEFFVLHSLAAGDAMHVARPTGLSGRSRPLIELSRRLEALDGSFAGVAHGTLDAHRFVESYAGLDLDPGHEITLQRADGVLLARWPRELDSIEQPVDRGIVPRAVRGGSAGETYHEASALRAADVIGSYAVVPLSGGQLIVDVNVLRSAALAPFWRDFAGDAGAVLLAVGALLVGGTMLALNLDRREALRTELAAATASARAAEASAARIARSEAELQRALVAEREMSAEQRRFIAIASHEFRTPLSIIDGAAQRIARDAGSGRLDLPKFTQRIRGGVTRLLEIIDRTLTMSRMDATHLELNGKIVDVAGLVREIVARFRECHPEFEISTRLPDDPLVIEVDPLLLDQALTHLLSNAVKYSARERRIDCVAEVDGDLLVLRVRDHGVGIPADEVPRLFTRYRRASTAGGTPGLGLGLCVVRSILQIHGGTVYLESVVGDGTTVTLQLPLRRAPPSAPSVDAAAA